MEHRSHTYEECYEAARRYGTVSGFRSGERKLYHYAHQRGWLKDYVWLVRERRRSLSWQECHDAAMGCVTKREFRERHNSEYQASAKRGWLKEFVWLKGVSEMTFEEVEAVAKRYRTYSDFFRGDSRVYNYAERHGWLDRLGCCGYEGVEGGGEREYKVYGRFDREKRVCVIRIDCTGWVRFSGDRDERRFGKLPELVVLREGLSLAEAMRCKSDFTATYEAIGYKVYGKRRVYQHKHLVWEKERCEAEARKYQWVSQFERGSKSAYEAASRNGWIGDYTWLKRRRVRHGDTSGMDIGEIASLILDYGDRRSFIKENFDLSRHGDVMEVLDMIYPVRHKEALGYSGGVDGIEVYGALSEGGEG